MSGDASIMTGRVVGAQAAHLFALWLVLGRIIPDQITCYDGFPGASLPFRALAALADRIVPASSTVQIASSA